MTLTTTLRYVQNRRLPTIDSQAGTVRAIYSEDSIDVTEHVLSSRVRTGSMVDSRSWRFGIGSGSSLDLTLNLTPMTGPDAQIVGIDGLVTVGSQVFKIIDVSTDWDDGSIKVKAHDSIASSQQLPPPSELPEVGLNQWLAAELSSIGDDVYTGAGVVDDVVADFTYADGAPFRGNSHQMVGAGVFGQRLPERGNDTALKYISIILSSVCGAVRIVDNEVSVWPLGLSDSRIDVRSIGVNRDSGDDIISVRGVANGVSLIRTRIYDDNDDEDSPPIVVNRRAEAEFGVRALEMQLAHHDNREAFSRALLSVISVPRMLIELNLNFAPTVGARYDINLADRLTPYTDTSGFMDDYHVIGSSWMVDRRFVCVAFVPDIVNELWKADFVEQNGWDFEYNGNQIVQLNGFS